MPATLRRGAFCLFALALTSLEAEERKYGPKDLLSEVFQRSPDVHVTRFPFEAATERPSLVSTLPKSSADYTNFGAGNPFLRLDASEFG